MRVHTCTDKWLQPSFFLYKTETACIEFHIITNTSWNCTHAWRISVVLRMDNDFFFLVWMTFWLYSLEEFLVLEGVISPSLSLYFLAPIDERLVYLAVNQRWLALIMTVLRLHESIQLSPSWIRHFTQCITRCHFFLLRWFGASANMNLSLKASAKSSPISSFCQWWVGRFWRNMRIPWEKGNRFKIIKINYRSCKKFVVNLYCEDLRINYSRPI